MMDCQHQQYLRMFWEGRKRIAHVSLAQSESRALYRKTPHALKQTQLFEGVFCMYLLMVKDHESIYTCTSKRRRVIDQATDQSIV